MIEWKETIVKNIGKVITGKTPSKNNPEHWGDKTLFITPTDFRTESKYIFKTDRYLSEEGVDKFKKNAIPPESVIVTCIGSDMGKVAINRFKATTNQQINSLIVSSNYDTDFIYYKLKSIYKMLRLFADGGSIMPIINKSTFENLILELPSEKVEQHQIAAILTSLDDKIDLLCRQNETLEAIAQTLFKRWFVEFEFPDENGLPYKSSGGKMVSSELGEIPEGWRVGKINEISTISTGKGLKRAEYIEKGSYPVYGANGEMGRTNSFLFDEKLIITGRVGTLGNIYIVNGKMWISDNVLILKPEENLFYFTYFAMKRINFKSLNRGSTQPLITQTDLKNYELIIPGEKLVDQFDLFSLGLFPKIENNMGQIDHLTKIRDILLPKLMSGQIRVK